MIRTLTLLMLTCTLSWGAAIARLHNFQADRDAGTKILSGSVDAEFNQIVSALNDKAVSQATAPTSPNNGDTWSDTSVVPPVLKIYDSVAGAFVNVVPAVVATVVQTNVSLSIPMNTATEFKTSFLDGSYEDQGRNFFTTSAVPYQWSFANIDTTNKKFGAGSYTFSGVDFSLRTERNAASVSFMDFSKSGAISVWYKGTTSTVTLWHDISENAILEIDASGNAKFTFQERDGSAKSVTGVIVLTDDVFHNIICEWVVGQGAGNDSITLTTDNASVVTLAAQDITVVDDGVGAIVVGSGKLRKGDTIYTAVTTPDVASPAWTISGTGTVPVVSTTDGVFSFNSIGTTTGFRQYIISGGANWTVATTPGWWVEWRMRIISTEGNGGFGLLTGDGVGAYQMTIKDGVITASDASTNETKASVQDTKKWHIYRVEINIGSADLYIDGQRIIDSVTFAGTDDNVKWGDRSATSGDNVNFEMDWFQFYQPVSDNQVLLGNKCSCNLDDMSMWNDYTLTATDKSNIQSTASDTLMNFIEGAQITNIGNSHPAVGDLISGYDYEESGRTSIRGNFTFEDDTPWLFKTKKRVIPTITFVTDTPINLSSTGAQLISVNGFSQFVVPSVGGTDTAWIGSWQAQTASKIKMRDFQATDFELVTGVPLFDATTGESTGVYTTTTERVLYTNVSQLVVDGDTKQIMKVITADPLVTVFIPMNNEETLVNAMFDDANEHIAIAGNTLCKKIMGDAAYKTHQDALRSLKKNQDKLAKELAKQAKRKASGKIEVK